MKVDDIKLLYDYNYWANERILTACAKLSGEQYVAPAAFPYGSVRATLVHILDTEYGWRILCQNGTVTPYITEGEIPTLEALSGRWREDERAMRDYLSTLRDADMDGLVRFTLESGELRERVRWHCLLHVVNHGTQHRAEAAAMLTGFAASPGDLDFTDFLLKRARK